MTSSPRASLSHTRSIIVCKTEITNDPSTNISGGVELSWSVLHVVLEEDIRNLLMNDFIKHVSCAVSRVIAVAHGRTGLRKPLLKRADLKNARCMYGCVAGKANKPT